MTEQLEHFSAVKEFYQERGVDKTDAEVMKTIHKFSKPVWTNPENGIEETTGGYDNMWSILRNKYPPTAAGTNVVHLPISQPAATTNVAHLVTGSRQVPTHVAIGTVSPMRSVQANASPMRSVQANASPMTSVVHLPISPRSVVTESAPVYVYAPQAGSPVMEVPLQSQPYPVPQQIIAYPEQQFSPMSSQQMQQQLAVTRSLQQRNTVGQSVAEEVTATTPTKKRTLSPEMIRNARAKAAAQSQRSDMQGVGHYAESNVNSTVRQLALQDQAGPRGFVNPGPSTGSTKPASKYYKLVTMEGNKGPSGKTTPGGGGPSTLAAQKAQLSGIRIPNTPSIIRSELAKEDVALNEFRALDNHRVEQREVTGTFRTGSWRSSR